MPYLIVLHDKAYSMRSIARIAQNIIRTARTMSTANTIRFATESTSPSFYLPGISQASTDKVNHLIQENHDNHHIFFNSDGFHNHIAHHLPTLWALRSTPEQLQKHYDNNKSYQRPLTDRPKTTLSVATQLEDPRNWSKFLGKQQYYPDFLQYFQNEITNSSWQEVLQRYLFSRGERADDMLVRLFGGFLVRKASFPSRDKTKLYPCHLPANHLKPPTAPPNPPRLRHRIHPTRPPRRSSSSNRRPRRLAPRPTAPNRKPRLHAPSRPRTRNLCLRPLDPPAAKPGDNLRTPVVRRQ